MYGDTVSSRTLYVLKEFSKEPSSLFAMTSPQNTFTSPDYLCSNYSLLCIELQDTMFLVRCIKYPPNNLNLSDHVLFSSSSTRASKTISLWQNFCRSSTTRHFYFNRVVHLWNALPTLDLSKSCSSIKMYITNILWNQILHAFFTSFVHVHLSPRLHTHITFPNLHVTHHPGYTRNWCLSFNNFPSVISIFTRRKNFF